MTDKSIAEKIIALKEADLKLRDKLVQSGQLGQGYDEEMERLHNKNAALLEAIIDRIGYPTIDQVGEEASEAAWLVIQHSIGQPSFMKKCAKLLEKAVLENQADPKGLAYLTDRIALYEGKKQEYGTQFDWDENGELSPHPFDDLSKVNQRRKRLGLKPLEEQIAEMRRRAKVEKETPPKDFEKKKAAFEEWKRKVGWIK